MHIIVLTWLEIVKSAMTFVYVAVMTTNCCRVTDTLHITSKLHVMTVARLNTTKVRQPRFSELDIASVF